jgi:hypothetical protein
MDTPHGRKFLQAGGVSKGAWGLLIESISPVREKERRHEYQPA